MKTRSVSLVVPVYNEKEIIEESIVVFKEHLTALSDDFEIVIVDDGSSDGTADIALRLAREDARLRVFVNNANVGSGASLWRGFQEARKELIVSNFADRPFDLKELANLLPFFDSEEVDFVVVTRKDRSANPFFRQLTSYANFLLIRLLFGTTINDFQFVQCYRKKALQGITVTSRHTFAAPELIIKALSKGLRYKEYKACFYPRPGGKAKYSSPRLIFRSVAEIFAFYRGWKKAGKGFKK